MNALLALLKTRLAQLREFLANLAAKLLARIKAAWAALRGRS